ncbi:MAG: phosphopyruvate hydratase [Candidatus Moraniibacteriota bacterium]
MPKIIELSAREILDSRGNPTVEAQVRLDDGTEARAGVPSGASTGIHEALELRDNDPKRYHGLGVLTAVKNIETEIREAVLGMEATDQKALDKKMIALDGTENKSRLGANAILGVSLVVARAAAKSTGQSLADYLELLYGGKKKKGFPIPMFNILNGGKHADSGLSAQEFKIIPAGIPTYPEQLRAGSEIFHSLKKLLEKNDHSVAVGDEGGFAPHLESHAQALEMLKAAIEAAGYRFGEEVFLGLDVAASSFYEKNDTAYLLKPENVKLSRESLVNLYREWIKKYALVSIEDGLEEEDFSGWTAMREKIEKESAVWGKPALLIGDDLLVTNVKRLKLAIAAKACNAVLIKVNQIGTLTETLDCMRLATKNKMTCMISHRSGETVDDFIADLAVGTGAEYIKSGSLSRGERLAKYNRLLALWEERENKNANE